MPGRLAITAAAGLLLTVTTTVGSLIYDVWALRDRLLEQRLAPARAPSPADGT